MKNIYLLGATGSIGLQVLEVVDLYKDDFRVISITANTNLKTLKTLIDKYHPKYVSVGSETAAFALSKQYTDIEFGFGTKGLIKAATYNALDPNALMVNALVGMVGLVPTVETIKIKRNIALANKETLVVGGFLIKKLLKKSKSLLYPIDSEHSAIWQSLQGENKGSIKKVIITASGGAFRDLTKEQLNHVCAKDALKHPNWTMGNKITIDSATMMNKGFEIIEAAYLFDLELSQIETLIHRESIVHSLVEFVDSSIICQMGTHDMRLPIQYALNYPVRLPSLSSSLDLKLVSTLHFEKLDEEKYPCIVYAKQAFQRGGSCLAVLNSANEACVSLFLKDKITYLQIESIIKKAIDEHVLILEPTLKEILNIAKETYEQIYRQYDL